MSSFTREVELEPFYILWKNIHEFEFYYRDDRTGEYVKVPSGEVTDLPTLPLLVQILLYIPIIKRHKWLTYFTDKRYWPAWLLHDFMTGQFNKVWAYIYEDGFPKRQVTWQECTDWNIKALQVLGCDDKNFHKLLRIGYKIHGLINGYK